MEVLLPILGIAVSLLTLQCTFSNKVNKVWREGELFQAIKVVDIINPNHTIPEKFKALLAKYPNIDTRAMGFHNRWESEPLWRKK